MAGSSLRFGILTVSDRSAAGKRPDASGPALTEKITSLGWKVTRQAVVPDEVLKICSILRSWCNSNEVDVLLTTGGTGFSPRDVTPEATLAVVNRLAPGLTEAMRAAGLLITPHAMLSRGVAGMCQKTLIVNLPGSPKGALENLEVILPVLPHAVELIRDFPQPEAGHHLSP